MLPSESDTQHPKSTLLHKCPLLTTIVISQREQTASKTVCSLSYVIIGLIREGKCPSRGGFKKPLEGSRIL